MADGLPVDPDFALKWKIKRMGKDKNDIFWTLGKVHGIENVAFATEEQLQATKGDPFKIQALVDEINDSEKPTPPPTHDSVVSSLNEQLDAYKAVMDKIGKKQQILDSDLKKLLSLPFFLSKRQELPEPKLGQKEWDLFTKMHNSLYNDYENAKFDDEEKITEFNYENYIPKIILDKTDTKSDDFKNMIKAANFLRKTKLE